MGNTVHRKQSRQRAAVTALYVGAALTLAATVAPYIDLQTGQVLADHIRDGYPQYSRSRVNTAVTTWMALLTVAGVLGLGSWLWTIWAVKTHRRWTREAATAIFVAGTGLALTALLTKDTSGEVGLAPLLGWIGLLPCSAGLCAVVMLWRTEPERAS